jgi:hypothetical protein
LLSFEGFDKECFLIGTLDDNMGHYQTFTANKSVHEIDEDIKGRFLGTTKFIADTMACKRITTYNTISEFSPNPLSLLVKELFKKEHPDLRLLFVHQSCCPVIRYYGSEIMSEYDKNDSLYGKECTVDLFSLSLAKVVAGYYFFDCDNHLPAVISSGGDIGYKGFINKDRFVTEAQKLSFILGFFLRYEHDVNFYDRDNSCFVRIRNSVSSARFCMEILNYFNCRNVKYIDGSGTPVGQYITFIPSAPIKKLGLQKDIIMGRLASHRVVF